MRPDLTGMTVAVLGGDTREMYLAAELAHMGASVRAAGLPLPAAPRVVVCEDVSSAVQGAQAVVLPVPGVNDKGQIYATRGTLPLYLTEENLGRVPPGTPVFVGAARPVLRELTRRLDLVLVELMDLDHVAILNSIPTAEGAVMMAMERLPITLHGSEAFVVGFGRTGVTLGRVLHALGARTTVVARSRAQRARAVEMGLRAIDFGEFPEHIARADVIFNTVPAVVLTAELLREARPGLLIIDLASAPGGTDFAAAERLGITALLAPGLPGKVAPKTAGRLLAVTIAEYLTGAR
ncbi:MAG: dipicolinate synthase subunit DpsA [Firmicutes bacterium]|nr:dipicolinate synthase subunit DpsA [Bacillota bacterium]